MHGFDGSSSLLRGARGQAVLLLTAPKYELSGVLVKPGSVRYRAGAGQRAEKRMEMPWPGCRKHQEGNSCWDQRLSQTLSQLLCCAGAR